MGRSSTCELLRPVWVMLALAAAVPSSAQSTSSQRVEISGNVGVLGTQAFTQTASFDTNVETGSLTATHAASSALAFDIGAGIRAARQWWVQVSVTSANHKGDAAVSADIPHPLLFNHPRSIEGSQAGVTHNELGVHIDAMWRPSARGPVDFRLMAGPTLFNVKQDLVSQVNYSESYPYDSATFNGASTSRHSRSAVGFNVGLDVGRALTPAVGLGAIIRYSRANIDFSDAGTGDATVKAGGVEASGGVRVRF